MDKEEQYSKITIVQYRTTTQKAQDSLASIAGAGTFLIADNFPKFPKIWDDFYDNKNDE